jgi:hypothetical protein
VQPWIVLFQALEVQLREIDRLHVPAFDEPRQMCDRQERELLVGSRHRDVNWSPPQRLPLDCWQLPPRRQRIEDERRRRAVAKAGRSQPRESGEVSSRCVQLLEQPSLLVDRERDAGDPLRRLQHFGGDRPGILGNGRERARHQRGADARAGETFDEPPAIDRELFFVHASLRVHPTLAVVRLMVHCE